MERAKLKSLLNADYNFDGWLEIYRYLFAKVDFFANPSLIEHNEPRIAQFKQIGYVSLSDDSRIALFEAEVAAGVKIARNRVYLNNVISRWIASGGLYSAAIGIFYSREQPDYRFTFAMSGAKFTADMKVEGVKTNPKRYTYVLGKNEKCETAARRFEELNRRGGAISLTNVEDAFSVEKLNKEFFGKVSDSFYKLVGGTVEKKSFDHVLRLPGINYEVDKKNNQKHQKFAVRLIGRIVFCWFLKFKKSAAGKPLIPEGLLSSKAVENSGSSYYHDILEKLFFECLNTPVEKRNSDILDGADDIPFLNGGLFEPQHGDYYGLLEIAGHYQSKHYATLTIPDEWFLNFFETLEQYNFTIDENSIFDADISVDPEILGCIFENLLAEINPQTGETERKSTGSYYTPREIVDYMVDQSLIECLKTKTGLHAERLQHLFSYQEQILDDKDKVKFTDPEKRKISDALHQIKALDPACGSGAFPMGILHKMLYALSQVDPDSRMWYDQQVSSIADYKLKENLLAKFHEDNVAYIHKLGIINHCVYGVDIQPIAVEISKLRFFLSLVVDENVDDTENNRGIKPLPNLDFKFVAANSLISAPGNHGKSTRHDTLNLGDEKMVSVDFDFADIDPFFTRFDELAEKYFYADNKEDKAGIRAELEAVVKTKVDEKQRDINSLLTGLSASKRTEREVLKQKHHKQLEKLQRELQLWESYLNVFKGESAGFFEPRFFFPDANDGFDIVIGNPPYVQIQNFSGMQEQKDWEQQRFETYAKTGDIYCLFYERGYQLLKNGGLLTYITSNKWMRANYGKALRRFFKTNGSLLQLIDFGDSPIFENATTYTNILVWKKNKEAGKEKTNAWDLSKAYASRATLDEMLRKHGECDPLFSEDSFVVVKGEQTAIKRRIEKVGVPLKDWDISIYRGILTGLNEAFIVNRKKKDELIAQDPKSAEILKPILRGRDIKRYKAEFADLWIITTFPALQINIDNYPAVKNYLKSFGERLEQTGADGCRKKTGNKWFEVQDTIAYYPEFEKEKIAWLEMSPTSNFTYDTECYFVLNTAYILTGKSLNYLTAILNSKVLDFYFPMISTDVRGQTRRYIKQYVELLPVPRISPDAQLPFEILVDCILFCKSRGDAELNSASSLFESVIDGLVYDLYFADEMKAAHCYITDRIGSVLKPFTTDDTAAFKIEYIKTLEKFINRDETISHSLVHRHLVKPVQIILGDKK